jgi:hypothetical protein
LSKHTVSAVVVFALLLVGLSLLAACQAPQTSAMTKPAAFDFDQAADNMAYRWVAMGRAYERMGLLNDGMDAGDITAFRWEAMGRAYERMGLLNDGMDAGDIAAYRWEAMGRAYERMGLLNDDK